MLPTKFRFIWLSHFGGEDFKKSADQKQELMWRPRLLINQDKISNF
jgi:hypothetical protein